MHKFWLKRLVYVVVLSTIVTLSVMALLLSIKDSSCDGLVSSIPEFTAYQGPCASDGNAFAFMALLVFLVTSVLVLCNLWVIKRLKI